MALHLHLGLRRRLLLVMLSLLALSLAGVWAVATGMARQSLAELSHDTSLLSAQSLANAIQLQIDDARADASVVSRLDMAAEVIDTGDPKKFTWYADELIRTKGRYAALWVADVHGKVIAANGFQGDPKKSLIGRDIASELWYERASKAPEAGAAINLCRPALLQGILDADETVFGFAFPINDLVGERVGTLVTFIPSHDLNAMLSPALAQSANAIDAFAALVDGRGSLVTLPDLARRNHVWDEVDKFARFESPLAGAALTWGWRVASLRRAQLLEAPVEALSTRLQAVFGLSLLIAAAVLYVLAQRLLMPIFRLTTAAVNVDNTGDFKPIEVQGTDEIAQLTMAFNHMMSAIAVRETRLDSARRELQDLFNKIPSAIFVVNNQGHIELQYSAYCETVFDNQNIAGTHVSELLRLQGRRDQEAISRMLFWLTNIFGADQLQWDLSQGL